MSSRQSAAALKDWLLGTQAAPACEAGAFIRDGLATAHRSLSGARRDGGVTLTVVGNTHQLVTIPRAMLTRPPYGATRTTFKRFR